MSKDKIIHYRYYTVEIHRQGFMACNPYIEARDFQYTDDVDDTTCINCLRTATYKRAYEKKHSIVRKVVDGTRGD